MICCLAAKAPKTGLAASRFLAPTAAASVSAYFSNRRGIELRFNGGYEGAERMRDTVGDIMAAITPATLVCLLEVSGYGHLEFINDILYKISLSLFAMLLYNEIKMYNKKYVHYITCIVCWSEIWGQ